MTIPIDGFPPVPHLSYEEVRNYIQSGDIILCSGNSVFSSMIKRATGSIWSHVGFIIRWNEIDRLIVLESVESIGVRAVALSHYVNDYDGNDEPYDGKILLARHDDFKEDNVSYLSRKAVDLLGKNYDKGEILRISKNLLFDGIRGDKKYSMPDDNKKYICSEYVYECYKSIGLQIDHNDGGFISPADFAKEKKINAICIISV